MDGFCLSITSSLRLLGSSPRTSVRQDVGRLRLSPSISEVNGGEWHAHERREQRTEASGLLTALTSVPWSSCSVHRVSFPPSLRPPVGSSIPSLRPPDGTNDVSDVRWTEGGDGVGRDSS